MVTVAGPLLRIEPHQAAGIDGVWTPLAELIAPASTSNLVAVVTASALSGADPAMGSIRVWNRSVDGFSQVRIFGTQTVLLSITGVTAGDLIQIAGQPYRYDGVWEDSRVWVHRAEVTLVDFVDTPETAPTYAPGLPPTQVSISSGAGSSTLTYIWGESWGPFPTSTAWRFRPVGGDTWEVLPNQTASGTVVLPFDLDGQDWEVQGQQTTIGGTSPWGPTVVWSSADETDPISGGFGFAFGENFGL